MPELPPAVALAVAFVLAVTVAYCRGRADAYDHVKRLLADRPLDSNEE